MNNRRKVKLANSLRKPAVFLDRDGTINYDEGYTYKFSEFRFRPYILKGLKYLFKKKIPNLYCYKSSRHCKR